MSPQELNLIDDSQELHTLAIGHKTLAEASAILDNPSCAEKTKNLVLAKVQLFDKAELAKAIKTPEKYNPDIVQVARRKLKTG